MKCSACGFDSADGFRFCGRCGAELQKTCTACGAANPASFRFCGSCGQALKAAGEPGGAPAGRESSDRNERRQVTALFCDLVGSTPLSLDMDAEDFGEVIRGYRALCADAVERNGGTIIRFLGDGVLASFGYPKAHEDNPQRAARAALGILSGIREGSLSRGDRAHPLTVRIGIHTGPVVAGGFGAAGMATADELLGETMNVAARLEQLAQENTAVTSEATQTLIADGFELAPLGLREAKGLEAPISVYRIVRELPGAGRRRRGEELPLVGREQERDLIVDRWRRARQGQGQCVLITGEAGIGKSRLIDSIVPHVTSANGFVARAYCSAYSTASALRPFIELLQTECGLAETDDIAERRAKLASALAPLELKEQDTVALGLLLDLPPDDPQVLQDLTPMRRRQDTFEAVAHWLTRHADRNGGLLVVEDLHWADDSTLDLLESLSHRTRAARLLAVYSARPEFNARWAPHPSLIRLALDRLSPEEARHLLFQEVGVDRWSPETVAAILRRADGVPLFVRELARSAPHGDSSDPISVVPTTLRDLLRSRLDNLDRGHVLLQYAAAFGRVFSTIALAAALGAPVTSVKAELDYLVHQGFIEYAGDQGDEMLSFHHALVQDEVYESTLKAQRRRIHGQIADTLARTAPDMAERQPELLATHLTRAGRVEDAIKAWQRAGRRASERSASAEAAQHYANALQLLADLPAAVERDQLELSLRISLGSQLIASKGNAAPEVEAAYRRAEALCASVSDNRSLFRALRGLQTFAMVRGRVGNARRLGERLLGIARELDDDALLLQAHRPLGLAQFYCGRFEDARRELVEALEGYDPERHRTHRFEYGSDPAVLARCNLAWVLWFLGRPRSAEREVQASVAYARTIEHPHSLAFGLSFAASIFQCAGRAADALAAAEELRLVAEAHVFPYWASWADALGGWAQASLSGDAGGVDRLRSALHAYRATGAELMRPYFLGLLADALHRVGDPHGSVDALREAIDIAEELDIGFYLPELLRSLAMRGRNSGLKPSEQHDLLIRAGEMAERQGSVSLLLRTLRAQRETGLGHGDAIARMTEILAQNPELHDSVDGRVTAGVNAQK